MDDCKRFPPHGLWQPATSNLLARSGHSPRQISASQRRAVAGRQLCDEVGSHATEAGKPQAFRCAGKPWGQAVQAQPPEPHPAPAGLAKGGGRRKGCTDRRMPSSRARQPQGCRSRSGGQSPGAPSHRRGQPGRVEHSETVAGGAFSDTGRAGCPRMECCASNNQGEGAPVT